MIFHRIGDFYRRFKMPVDEEEEFYKFRSRVNDLIRSVAYGALNHNDTKKIYGLLVGSPDVYQGTLLDWYIKDANSLYDLCKNIEFLFISFEATGREADIERLYEAVSFALGISPLIGIEIAKSDKGVVFYPKGAEVLDPALIDDVLTWLVDYTDANNAYISALKLYLTKDPGNYRNVLDNLRVSVEELLRALMGNKRSLEKQKKDLLAWLRSHEVNQSVINYFCEFLFGSYRILQNEEVKHGNAKFSEPEIENILYLTGTLLRFLIRIKQQGKGQDAIP